MIKIEKLVVGQLQTNCYLVYDDKIKDCLIIDPGDDADYIERRIADLKLNPKYIVATHGHFDHVLGVTELKLAYSIPFLIHKADLFLLQRTKETAKHFLGIEVDPTALPDKFIKEKDEICLGSEKLIFVETPGHTPGGICLIGNNVTMQQCNNVKVIFTGDTLFAEGVGRTDFSYSSKKDLDLSIRKIKMKFTGFIAYPGHGEEMRSNYA